MTRLLVEMVKAYNAIGIPSHEKLTNFMAWPLHLNVQRTWQADNINEVDIISVSPPEKLLKEFGLSEDKSLPPESDLDKLIRAESLTRMRKEMNDNISVRIILGGATDGYKSYIPGILQEFCLALDIDAADRPKEPVYLLGGWGGCARQIGLLIQGEDSCLEAISHPELFNFAQAHHELIGSLCWTTPDSLCKQFKAKGWSLLSNGLSDQENELLFRTRSLDLAISVILGGMKNLISCR